MTTPLVIVGAGGFARETVELVRAVNDVSPTWDLLGFLDDDPALAGVERVGVPVIGPLDRVHELGGASVVVCIASPYNITVRQRVVARLGLPDGRYATLVHPAASLARSVRVGAGSVVHAGVVATADLTIGRHVAVMPAVVLTHDDVVADCVTFGAGVRVAGGVSIGESAYVGSGSLIRENLTIGAGSLVGMGAVVTRPVPPGEVWAGVPARFVRPAGDVTAGMSVPTGHGREERI